MIKADPYQIIGAKYIVDNKRSLLADEMGTGKTAQAIMAKSLLESQKKKDISTLVMCPNSVKEHWEKEIGKWYYKHEDSNILTIDGNLKYSDIENLAKKAKKADFTIINYDMLSNINSKKSKKILNQLNKLRFGLTIGDEIHNVKNPKAYRTKSVKKIADKSEYLALLSGTPVPNSVVDIYMIMSLIDPKNYQMDFDNSSLILRRFYNIYKKDPGVVKRLFGQKTLRRLAEDYIKKYVPTAEYKNLEVKLNGNHEKVYTNIYNNDNLSSAVKLNLLLKASLDPSLVNPKYITDKKLKNKLKNVESCKYKALDDIIRKETKKGGKVVVFTSHFKKGVTDKLFERYYKYGACVIDGDVNTERKNGNYSDREKTRQKFQKDKKTKVLIATTDTMNEGVDLTAATSIVFLDKPYTHSSFDQAVKRSKRRGEIKKDKLTVYSLIAKNHVPTIDQGIEKLLKDKERVMKYLLSGHEISLEDLKLIANGKASNLKPIKQVMQSSRYITTQHYIKWRNAGAEKIMNHIKKYPEIQKEIINLYLMDFWNTLPGNTAKVVKKIVKKIEKKQNLEKKLDICCGPGVLSMALNEKTFGIDIDPYALKMSKKTSNKKSKYQLATAQKMPYKKGKIDLAVCSLAYQMFSLGKKDSSKINEREAFFRESNRVLKKNGYLVMATAGSLINKEDAKRYEKGLAKLGFQVKKDMTGFVSSNNNKNNFNIYVVTAQKKSNSSNKKLKDSQFKMYMDTIHSQTAQGKMKVKKNKNKLKNFGSSKINDELIQSQTIDNFVIDGHIL